ncbi:hypothetical protein RRG08_001912 [Elysia crispata]|uniref:Uncharacterized protein n=1 Tax=Elysia crispata TaxID=231223 RepID=A0AAE1ECK8_9GAST|nr:hypothetical protein RRG08_001912 [Elysia crispata]
MTKSSQFPWGRPSVTILIFQGIWDLGCGISELRASSYVVAGLSLTRTDCWLLNMCQTSFCCIKTGMLAQQTEAMFY